MLPGMVPLIVRTGPLLDPILSIFADGTDGFYLDFSQIDRTFQESTGITPADDATESIGLALEGHTWAGRTLSQELAMQPEIVPGSNLSAFVVTTGGVTKTDTSFTSGGGTGVTFGPLTVGATYEIDVAGPPNANLSLNTADAVTPTARTELKVNVGRIRITVAAGRTYFYLRNTSAGTTEIASVSIKRIPGNHGQQASSGSRPTRQAGGIARFDGTDDSLLTSLAPAASFSIMYKGKMTSSLRVLMGSRAAADTRAFIGTDAAGLLAGGVGAHPATTIKGGSDIRGMTGVGALAYGGGIVRLYWNGAEVYSGPISGSPNTSVPLRIGGLNDNGVDNNFAQADIHYALAIKKSLTPSEIAAITNFWGPS